MSDIQAGDTFCIIGPAGGWATRWFPNAWTSWPDDPDSRRVKHNDVWIDFTEEFTALEVREVHIEVRERGWLVAKTFRTAKVSVWDEKAKDVLEVCVNLACDGKAWTEKVRDSHVASSSQPPWRRR